MKRIGTRRLGGTVFLVGAAISGGATHEDSREPEGGRDAPGLSQEAKAWIQESGVDALEGIEA